MPSLTDHHFTPSDRSCIGKGFTLVEIIIVIAVIAILAAITTVAYSGVQDKARTSNGRTLATQIAAKAESFKSARAAYPTLGEMNAIPSLVPEAQVDDPSLVITGGTVANQRTEAPYENGTKVIYRRPSVNTGCVLYWDYVAGTHIAILLGSTTPHANCT